MRNVAVDGGEVEARRSELAAEYVHEKWMHWPVNWSAVWVGTLAAIAVLLLVGLIAIALGVHALGPQNRVVDLRKFGLGALFFSIFGYFLAFAIGGWIAGKIAGILRSEPAMVHGAIVWLVAIPLMLLLASLGAGSYLGGWYAGLSGTPAWATSSGAPFDRVEVLGPNATADEVTRYREQTAEYRNKVEQWNQDTPRAVRNSALGAVTALLLSLMGSVVGGWMASGEPMNFSYHRTRPALHSGW